MTHLTRDEVEALVLGVAPATEGQRVHLAACPECAERLAREARFELELHLATGSIARAAAVSQRWPALSRAARLALPIAATLALVALGARLIAGGSARDEVPATHPIAVRPAADSPCLVDPITLAPGHDVFVPEPPGLHTPGPYLD